MYVFRFETRNSGWIDVSARSYSQARAHAARSSIHGRDGLTSRIPSRVSPAIRMVDREVLVYQSQFLTSDPEYAQEYRIEFCTASWQ